MNLISFITFAPAALFRASMRAERCIDNSCLMTADRMRTYIIPASTLRATVCLFIAGPTISGHADRALCIRRVDSMLRSLNMVWSISEIDCGYVRFMVWESSLC